MSDKQRKIDEFLKFFRDIAIQNPGHQFVQEEIYYHLTSLGVPSNENYMSINNLFDNWMQHFESNPNSRVFVDPKWNYFCQFVSADRKARDSKDHLKVYIPLDSTHIEKGAKEIFEFLSRNGISHGSKIGSHVRFDDIVIRLINPNDVSKLISFINSNQYIQEGLIPANPFAFSINGIAMAVDGSLSYNSTVASMILFYINEKRRTNSLETVNVNDFYSFVVNYYNYVFFSAKGLEKLNNDFPWKNNRFETVEAQFVNYKNVFELMIKSINDSFTFNDYLNHYFECSNSSLRSQKENQLMNIRMNTIPEQVNVPDNNLVGNTDEMLLQIIDVMNEKYNNQFAVLSSINRYISTGKEECITRYRNLRNMVISSTFREDLQTILRNNNMSFMDYAEGLLSKRKHPVVGAKTDEKIARSTLEKQVILRIKEIIEIMSNKYSEKTARINLEQYLKTGEPSKFTRDYNLRERIVNSTFRADLKQVLEYRGLSLNDYLNAVINTKIVQSEVLLEQAILETYSKYQEKYLTGETAYSGKYFVTSALKQLIEHGNYRGFTRDNGIREKIMNSVTVNEIIAIIKETFGLENDKDISNANVSQLIDQYVERVLENNTQKKL